MAARGSSPPLFELLGRRSPEESSAAAEPAVKPRVKVELKPAPAPEPPAGDERVRQFGSASVRGGSVRLPISYLYIATAAVALALILVWAVAFKMGGQATERRLGDEMARALPPTIDPLIEPGPANAAPKITTPKPAPVEARREQRPPPAQAGPSVLTSSGPVPEDPREPGLNYLVLESNMPRDEAERLVAFLSGNGHDAIGVPMLDQEGRPTNNPARYRIVLTRGFPGRGFSASASTRDSILSEVTRLGATWQQDFKGSTRLSSPQWTKYTP